MKRIFLGLIFWASFLLIMFILFAIAEVLAKIITIEFVMTVVYIAIAAGIIFILKK